MSESVTFGGVTFPLPALPAGAIKDPIAGALLDYFAYWLNTSLNTQMALVYPVNGTHPGYPQAVPAGQRYPFDPKETWPQLPTPALYMWWSGSRSQPWSILKDRLASTYELLWIGPQQQTPKGNATVAGMEKLVNSVLRLASDRGYHPDYGYNGAPEGEPIFVSLGIQGFQVTDSSPGQLRPVPSGRGRSGHTDGAQVHHYPAVKAKFMVFEIIEQTTPTDPTDARGDSVFAVNTNELGDLNNTVEFAQMHLPAPDGSDDGDE